MLTRSIVPRVRRMSVHKPIKSDPWPCTLVTGASSGLGWALALQLAQAGTTVIALGQNQARLHALKQAAGASATLHPWVADLGDTPALPALAMALIAAHPELTRVIHNAGVQYERQLEDPMYAHGAIVHELAVNLMAPIALTQALLPHLRRKPQACVINVSSGLAYAPKRGAAVYAASKAGLTMFSRAMRLQLEGSEVRMVDVVLPLVDTPMTRSRTQGKLSAAQAATELIQGVDSRQSSIHVGMAKVLPWLARVSPGLLARLMAR